MILSCRLLLAIPQLFLLHIPLYLLSRIFGHKKNYWLITERPTEARDNGYVLFKWIRENHPNQQVIYAIRKSSPDYEKVRSLGKVIEYGSLKHWYYLFFASVCCDTAWDICSPNSLTFILTRDILPPKNKRVFLQHGITKDFMSQGLQQKLKADLFVCGAYPEWEYISKEFGYGDKAVRYLGFPRFDKLEDTSARNKSILFIPTWRMNLSSREFKDSDYFKGISSFLSNTRLKKHLEDEGVSLIFFLHPAITDKKDCFTAIESSHVKILSKIECDMQDLICSANMLITDYSSVAFDFAYLNKPVLYYQYDYVSFRKNHYKEGYFDYERDGFGPVIRNEKDLIDAICLVDSFKVEDEYKDRISKFFPLRDKNNSQRNYEAIKEIDRV